jgi:hypothetical protein
VAARLRLQTDFSIESGVAERLMKGGLILLKNLPPGARRRPLNEN